MIPGGQRARSGDITTYVYIAYAADGDVLYVGHTRNVDVRMRCHRSTAEWPAFVQRIDIESYPSAFEAQAAERTRINDLEPIHNIHGNPRYWPMSYEADQQPAHVWRRMAQMAMADDLASRADAAA